MTTREIRLLLALLLCGNVWGVTAKVTRPIGEAKRIAGLKLRSTLVIVDVAEGPKASLSVVIPVTFESQGRSLLYEDQTLFVVEPDAPSRAWNGGVAVELTGSVTPVRLMATRADGAIEEERLIVRFPEWKKMKPARVAGGDRRKVASEGEVEPRPSEAPPPRQEPPPIAEPNRLRLAIGPDYVYLKRASASLSVLSLGAGLRYALSEEWGLGLGFAHGLFLNGGAGSAYSSIDFAATYAVTGSLTSPPSGQQPGTLTSHCASGLRAHLSLAQYLFFGTSVVPFSGFGFATDYEIPLSDTVGLFVGLKAEALWGNGVSITLGRLRTGLLIAL